MVFLVGTPKAIYMAIKNDRVSKRNTKLIERIVSEFQE